MEPSPMKKIAVFVDVQNIYYTVREQFSCHFNYSELWRRVSQQGEIVLANAYAIERNDPGQRGFQQRLREIGFEVKLNPIFSAAMDRQKVIGMWVWLLM